MTARPMEATMMTAAELNDFILIEATSLFFLINAIHSFHPPIHRCALRILLRKWQPGGADLTDLYRDHSGGELSTGCLSHALRYLSQKGSVLSFIDSFFSLAH